MSLETDAIVKLNIGGRKFCTYQSTLLKLPESLLGRMFSKEQRLSVRKDDKGYVFFDRNPDLFEHIIEYYRSETIPEVISEQLANEFSFWCILECLPEIHPEEESKTKETEHLIRATNQIPLISRCCTFVIGSGDFIEDPCIITGIELVAKSTVDTRLKIFVGLFLPDADMEEKRRWAKLMECDGAILNYTSFFVKDLTMELNNNSEIYSLKSRWVPCITLFEGAVKSEQLQVTITYKVNSSYIFVLFDYSHL
jgi:hypothetical protein